jgi:hypothetical protein
VKWLTVHVGGQKWRVDLVSPKHPELKDGEKCFKGRCLFEKCRIYIDKTVDEQLREDTLLHELLHAVLYVSGAATEAYENDEAVDERVVSLVTPMFHRLLKDLGFSFPKPPPGRVAA